MYATTEQTDREAHRHTAIVFLAPIEKYFVALGLDSLSHTEPLALAPLSNYIAGLMFCKKNPMAPLLLWSSGRVQA